MQPCTGSSRRKRHLRALPPVWGRGGRFVAELGGARNVATISRGLIDQLARAGLLSAFALVFSQLGRVRAARGAGWIARCLCQPLSSSNPPRRREWVARLDGDVRRDAYRGCPLVDARRVVESSGGRRTSGIVTAMEAGMPTTGVCE